jgi:hypothetical protein
MDAQPTIRQLIDALQVIAADYGDDLLVDVMPSIVVDLPAGKSVKPSYVADGYGGWMTLSGAKVPESEALADRPAARVLTFDTFR